ncbi:MAG: RsmD family RNA methyltransferase [Clostridia bacterium]|nr:RsmD family RNA methyltransferase [Clostridia bacterium]
MEIIKIASGKSKGLNLISERNEHLRPTKDRVKEALFNIIQFDINGRNF